MSATKSGTIVQMPQRGEQFSSRAAEALDSAERPEDVFGAQETVTYEPAAEDYSIDEAEVAFRYVPVDRIRLSPYQTRRISSESELEELARSIEQKGVLQPVLVRPLKEGEGGIFQFELIAGERRLKAARMAGLAFIPALIQSLQDLDAAQISVIENAQRQNLNPVEEALALKHLVDDFGMNQTDVARVIGKNRATVSNSLRLLQLEPEILDLLRSGDLTAGHGRALLALDDAELRLKLAFRTVQKALSVRALEELIQSSGEAAAVEEPSEEELAELAALQRQADKVQALLGIEEVSLSFDAKNRRRLNLTFDTEASWKRFMSKIR